MKKIVSMFLCVCMAIGLACMTAGCGNDEVLKRIDDLQTELQTQNDKIDGLQTQITQLVDRIDEMQEVINELNYKTAHDVFCTIKEAYNNGWLIKDDLQIIANYINSNIQCSESLNEALAKSIKKAWAIKLMEKDTASTKKLTEEDIGIVKYYGTYKECVIVKIRRLDEGYPGINMPYTEIIGGLTFNFDHIGPQVVVYKI